jgi:hypothetical protein
VEVVEKEVTGEEAGAVLRLLEVDGDEVDGIVPSVVEEGEVDAVVGSHHSSHIECSLPTLMYLATSTSTKKRFYGSVLVIR